MEWVFRENFSSTSFLVNIPFMIMNLSHVDNVLLAHSSEQKKKKALLTSSRRSTPPCGFGPSRTILLFTEHCEGELWAGTLCSAHWASLDHGPLRTWSLDQELFCQRYYLIFLFFSIPSKCIHLHALIFALIFLERSSLSTGERGVILGRLLHRKQLVLDGQYWVASWFRHTALKMWMDGSFIDALLRCNWSIILDSRAREGGRRNTFFSFSKLTYWTGGLG